MIIHCHSLIHCHILILCTGQIGELNEDVMGLIIPASCKSLMMALIFAITPGMQYCFWVTVFLGKWSFSSFSFVFILIMASHHRSWNKNRILPVVEYVYFYHAVCNRRKTTGLVWGPTVKWTWVKTPLFIWPSYAPALTGLDWVWRNFHPPLSSRHPPWSYFQSSPWLNQYCIHHLMKNCQKSQTSLMYVFLQLKILAVSQMLLPL